MWEHDRLNELWSDVLKSITHEDLAHDWLHVQRVTRWAMVIAKSVGANCELAGAAGILHDIINIPKDSAKRSLGGELSAIAGVEYLHKVGFTADEMNIITEAIRTCSWSSGKHPTNIIGTVLQDADRIDAIGALGLMRNIACAQTMTSRGTNGAFYHPSRPIGWNEPVEELDDRKYAIDHFFKKLLHLKSGMHTDIAKKEATKRHQWMIDFLEELGRELKCGG